MAKLLHSLYEIHSSRNAALHTLINMERAVRCQMTKGKTAYVISFNF